MARSIQALDLLGRKPVMEDGAALQLLMREIHATQREARRCDSPQLRSFAEELAGCVDRAMETARKLLCVAAGGEVELALANASVYLEITGQVVVAWIWLRQARVAEAKLPGAQGAERDFYQGKPAACACFFRWELPKTRHQSASRCRTPGSDTALDFSASC